MSRSLDASLLHSSTVPLIMRVFFSLSLSRVWGQDFVRGCTAARDRNFRRNSRG